MLASVIAAVAASALAVLAGWPSPLEATAEQLMQWTPVSLANVLLLHLGAMARPAALLGSLAVTMLAGGIAGALQRMFGCTFQERLAGFLLAALTLCLVFIWLIPPSTVAPELCFIAVYLAALAPLSASSAVVDGRREFLLRSAVIFGGAAVLLTLFSVRPLVRALAARRLFPYRAPRGLSVAGVTDLVTPNSRHYIMDKVLQYPEIGPLGWRLLVDGAVDRPLALDYGSLLARQLVSRYVTMECVDNPVGGPLISTALWTGVHLTDLLREAGARGDVVIFHGADGGYAESTSVVELERAGAMIAYGMNGQLLPREHGYPARLLVPGIYGFKSVKWLERIEVVHGARGGSWRSHGWTDTASIHTTTRIDVARRHGDGILLAGIAFAGTRGISAVEVRVNRGPWQRATLGPALSDATWVQWAVRLRGWEQASIEARAIDGAGRVQTGRQHGPYPDGSTGWASVTV